MVTACSPQPASRPGPLLTGVRFKGKIIETETVVMRSATGTVRWIRAEHRHLAKFQPD